MKKINPAQDVFPSSDFFEFEKAAKKQGCLIEARRPCTFDTTGVAYKVLKPVVSFKGEAYRLHIKKGGASAYRHASDVLMVEKI